MRKPFSEASRNPEKILTFFFITILKDFRNQFENQSGDQAFGWLSKLLLVPLALCIILSRPPDVFSMVEQYRATGASKSITLRPGMARHQSKETNTFTTS